MIQRLKLVRLYLWLSSTRNYLDGFQFVSGIKKLRILGADCAKKWFKMFGENSIEFLNRKRRILDDEDLELIVDWFLVSFYLH